MSFVICVDLKNTLGFSKSYIQLYIFLDRFFLGFTGLQFPSIIYPKLEV
jgi:hypothetical protein